MIVTVVEVGVPSARPAGTCVLMRSSRAACSRTITLTSVSTTPRTWPSDDSMRWMVGRLTWAFFASALADHRSSPRAALIWAPVIMMQNRSWVINF